MIFLTIMFIGNSEVVNVEVNCCACVETSSSMTASDVFLLPFELLNYSPIAPLMLFQIAVHYVNF